MAKDFDPASQGAPATATPAAAAAVFELTTDGVPPHQRFELWRDTALRRLDVERVADGANGFNGLLRRLTGTNAELWDHRTDPIWVNRTRRRCAADGRGDISIALVLDCTNATVENGRELTLNSGDLYVIDYSQPVRATRPKHRELALIIPRQSVTDILGDDLTGLAGTRLHVRGLASLLRSHMHNAGDEAGTLTSAEQAVTINAAASMALAALQKAARGVNDADQVADGLYIAACAAIERHSANPEFSPDTVASIVGCSRATLYRLFSRNGKSVAAAIWTARLENARKMLIGSSGRHISIAEIAFRCGFVDQSNFSRMFKRRYGMTPRDVRD